MNRSPVCTFSRTGPARPGSLLLSLLAMLVALTACHNPFDPDPYMRLRVPAERLRTIDAFDVSEATQPETAQPPAAPAEITLTIEQCRSLALRHNLDLQVELLNPTIARQSISEEEARFEALISAAAAHSITDTPTSTALDGSSTKGDSFNVGVDLPLTTGGTISTNLPLNRFQTDNVFSTLNPAYTTAAIASISQPLLRNAGVETNTHAIRIATYESQAVEARTKLQVMSVIADVDRFYWRLYAVRRLLEVRKAEYDLATQQLEKARRLLAQGDVAEIEVTRAESGQADTIDAIIQAEVALRERQRDLKRALHAPEMDIASVTIVIPDTQPNPVHYSFDASRLADAALQRRMELLELEIQLAMDDSTVRFNRNQVLPLLTLDYQYRVNGLGSSAGDALDVLGDKNFEDHLVAARLEMPLGNEAAKSRLRRSLLTKIQRLATKQQRELEIRLEVLNAVDRIEGNWQRILAARQRTILAARTLEAEQRQFDAGQRTSTDVLDARTNLTSAQSDEIAALADYEIAQTDLAVATGTLLGQTKVRWEPIEPDLGDDK